MVPGIIIQNLPTNPKTSFNLLSNYASSTSQISDQFLKTQPKFAQLPLDLSNLSKDPKNIELNPIKSNPS